MLQQPGGHRVVDDHRGSGRRGEPAESTQIGHAQQRIGGGLSPQDRRAGCKLAITGTPMENNLMELWALLSITAPGLFPNPDRFKEFYARPIERSGDADLLAQLRRRIRPLVLRRSSGQK